jgi:hypothetical protein
MIEVFRQQCGEVPLEMVVMTKDGKDITSDVIVTSVTDSIAVSVAALSAMAGRAEGKTAERPFTLDANKPVLNADGAVLSAKVLMYDLPKNVSDIVAFKNMHLTEKSTRVVVAPRPFAKGSVRLVSEHTMMETQ